MSASLTHKLGHAHERLQAGDIAGARLVCEEVLAQAPRDPQALSLLGVIYLMTGQAREAILPLSQALAAQPRHGAALENLGLAHLILGEFAEARRALSSAAVIPGAPASVFMRLGIALLNQGQHAEAVSALQRALELDPHNPDIHLNLGQIADRMGDPGRARKHFETALNLSPDHVDAMFNLGVVCLNLKELDAARLWFERVLAQSPRHADAAVNLGIVFEQQKQLEAAIASFRHALELDPALALASNNLAHALALQGRFEAAREQYLAALRLDPDLILAYEGLAAVCLTLGSLLKNVDTLQAAETAAQRASALDPSIPGPYGLLGEIYAMRGERERAIGVLESGFERTGATRLLGALMYQLRYVCDWNKWRDVWQRVSPLLDTAADVGPPFALLSQPATRAQQLAYTRRWAKSRYEYIAAVPAVRVPASRQQRRLRVGYLSSDFREHAVSDLLAEVLELHDRGSFEIFAYSYGPDDQSAMRGRLRKACEHFVDIARDTDDMAAARIAGDQLDILVDLNGHATGARTGVLARRPCAVQICWLGYAGTTGAGFIDYLIADEFVVPPSSENGYSERVLRLPHCYLPNDCQRTRPASLARSECGLPAHGFVFCCFNNVYKITPEIFACWMRLLNQIPHSVLWLPDDNRRATENLTRTALTHGIAPECLRFAPRVPALAQHLGRYRIADLALDTFPYTSHTTACDALWSDCLLVGLCGETFASRVSGSVLRACNLPELVTHTLVDYERLALKIAGDASFRRTLRSKLDSTKLTSPLFDSSAFARDLENLYRDL